MSHTDHLTTTRALKAGPSVGDARAAGASRLGNGNGFGYTTMFARRKVSGVGLQRDRLTYDDELAPGEKVQRRRAIRSRERAEVRRLIARGEC